MTTYLAKQDMVYKDPSTGMVLSILEELESPGTDYVSIQLHDDAGWKLEVYENGCVEFYNGTESRRILKKHVPHELVIQMWRFMQEGDPERIRKLMRSKSVSEV